MGEEALPDVSCACNAHAASAWCYASVLGSVPISLRAVNCLLICAANLAGSRHGSSRQRAARIVPDDDISLAPWCGVQASGCLGSRFRYAVVVLAFPSVKERWLCNAGA